MVLESAERISQIAEHDIDGDGVCEHALIEIRGVSMAQSVSAATDERDLGCVASEEMDIHGVI